ncbi:MAG: 2OG-Fe(II) oxygenase [Acidimicrobiales bacterium]
MNRPIAALDWDALVHEVDRQGYAVTPTPLLTTTQCGGLANRFDGDQDYRATIDMPRYRFGDGVYRYYRYPLPDPVAELREGLYPRLAPLANRWQEQLRQSQRFPDRLEDFVQRCNLAGQDKPTPLILRYEAGGYNCLHQDLYGEVAFPLQVAVALTEPGADFTGGETLLVEQRPRAQSRGTAITVPRGHGLIFPNRHRPVEGSKGPYRVAVRHGVSTVHSGLRLTLGIIFHEAA